MRSYLQSFQTRETLNSVGMTVGVGLIAAAMVLGATTPAGPGVASGGGWLWRFIPIGFPIAAAGTLILLFAAQLRDEDPRWALVPALLLALGATALLARALDHRLLFSNLDGPGIWPAVRVFYSFAPWISLIVLFSVRTRTAAYACLAVAGLVLVAAFAFAEHEPNPAAGRLWQFVANVLAPFGVALTLAIAAGWNLRLPAKRVRAVATVAAGAILILGFGHAVWLDDRIPFASGWFFLSSMTARVALVLLVLVAARVGTAKQVLVTSLAILVAALAFSIWFSTRVEVDQGWVFFYYLVSQSVLALVAVFWWCAANLEPRPVVPTWAVPA